MERNPNTKHSTYYSTSLVVVQVHHVPEVSPFLHHVDEPARELVAKLGVVAATTPLPVLAAGGPLLIFVVARAGVETAL